MAATGTAEPFVRTLMLGAVLRAMMMPCAFDVKACAVGVI